MLTCFLRQNRKILITVLLAFFVSAGGGECIMGDESESVPSKFWKAWKVDAADDDDAARDTLLGSLNAPDGSEAVVLEETTKRLGDHYYEYAGVSDSGVGYYAFQTVLDKKNETVFPFYLDDELTIYDGSGKPFDFVGLAFIGKIDGRLVGLYVSDNENDAFAYSVQKSSDEIGSDGRFDMFGFTDKQRESLKSIFTDAGEKNISFTLLIESEDADGLSVGGFFELSPNSMEKAPTPEPGTLLIFGAGVAGAGLAARRRLSDRNRPQ
ncbi:MAG: PEP-CTERM sorting domain-containing protein [Planctomycetaceae bacterium]|jgi:hypothetical protein|nr:PEP-CTERM sorting domain-containing protein [Planctomycetaceae bacterium]